MSSQVKSASVETEEPSGTVMDSIHSYVEQSVIRNKRPELLMSLYARYLDMCTLSDVETPLKNRQSLLCTLERKFGEKIKYQTPVGKKQGIIVYSSDTAPGAVCIAYEYASDDERTILKEAVLLCKNILRTEKKDVSENPTLDDLKGGDISSPTLLKTFFTAL